MNREIRNKYPKLDRYREASDWLVRLSASPPAETDVDCWLSWCEANPENLLAFEQMQRDWYDMEGLRVAPHLIVNAEGSNDAHRNTIQAWSMRRFSRAVATWSMAATLVGIAIMSYTHWLERPSLSKTLAATQRGPTTLPDGTSLLLSAKATAEVNFSRVNRDLTLQPGGEAFIRVRHHKSWPFVVHAGSVTITDVGTAFDVRREPGHVTVTVTEGVVDLNAPGPDGRTRWRAVAGYQVNYSEITHTAVVSSINPNSVLGWRRGELAYDGTPLSAVIDDVNRYSDVDVVISDPEVGRLPYSGTVFVASVQDWLSALSAKYPVVMSARANNVITLRMATISTKDEQRQN